ncbi:MAG: hypothetical protein ACE5KV_07770, partial [Thermoplasmata archaeon]
MAVGEYSKNFLVDPGIRSRNGKGTISLRLEVPGYLEGHAVEHGIEYEKLVGIFIPGFGQVVDRIQNVNSSNNEAPGRRENILRATSFWGTLKSIGWG